MALRTRRIAQGLAALALAAGAVLAASAPAQADAKECTSYLEGAGYIVGPLVRHACDAWAGYPLCYSSLLDLGVLPRHADVACYYATRW
ncbi:hypothetical protein GCM10009830_30010 [Glycomyces endophyticus]|uniref:Uncharacterized protein n=1 Tax=Glycomyces endophyticus TaxID=480996 RepID=A0ABP4T1T5_9ACTN